MAWRLAQSLETLRKQINTHYPNRSKVSDGTIGDAAHSKRKSDHNPREGIVCAFDITNDPVNGPNLAALIPFLLKDKRTRYVIFNKKIYNMSIKGGAARVYSGANSHQKHLHISCNWQFRDDTRPWVLSPQGSQVAPVLTAVQKAYSPKDAIAYFKGLGWSELASTALVANLMWESGGNAKPIPTIVFNAHGDKDKTGVHRSHGAGQWNERAGRYDALLSFARERQKAWDDPETQLSFLDHELHTSERRAGIALRAASTLEEAVAASILVWRPSIPHADKRLTIARKLLDAS